MRNDVFKTRHDTNYNTGSYLYHYSKFEKATKIISSDSLRFSNIYNLNDLTEHKPKIRFQDEAVINEEIYNSCCEINHLVKICCFTQDKPTFRRLSKKNDFYFTDYSGRGFALPRMWAQYSDDNKGICFVFDKAKLENAFKSQFAVIHNGPVDYVDRYTLFRFTQKAVDDFKNQVLSREICSMSAQYFMDNYPDYVKRNYFTKLSDWTAEYEYRIALFSEGTEHLLLKKLSTFLEGIVIGENVDKTEVEIIQKLAKNKVPIKKIQFHTTHIALEDVEACYDY